MSLSPTEILSSPRLTLRPFIESDSAALFDLYSDHEVIKYTDNNLHKSIEDTKKLLVFLNDSLASHNHIYWAIIYKPDNRCIGLAGLYHIDRKHLFASVQCILAKEFWRHGLMTEALLPVIHFGFTKLKLHRIEAQVYERHIASVKLFEKLRFKREALLHENFLIEGKFENSIMFSLLKNEFSSI